MSKDKLILRCRNGFVCKNENSSFCIKDVEILPLKAVPNMCPVKGLLMYLRDCKSVCLERNIIRPDRLWIDEKGKVLTKSKLRKWIRDIIMMFNPSIHIKSARFHSMRHQAASQLDLGGFSIDDIKTKMGWSGNSTFMKYYAQDTRKLNLPAVVAGTVMM